MLPAHEQERLLLECSMLRETVGMDSIILCEIWWIYDALISGQIVPSLQSLQVS